MLSENLTRIGVIGAKSVYLASATTWIYPCSIFMQCRKRASLFSDLVTQAQCPAHGHTRTLCKAGGTVILLAKPCRRMRPTEDIGLSNMVCVDFFSPIFAHQFASVLFGTCSLKATLQWLSLCSLPISPLSALLILRNKSQQWWGEPY